MRFTLSGFLCLLAFFLASRNDVEGRGQLCSDLTSDYGTISMLAYKRVLKLLQDEHPSDERASAVLNTISPFSDDTIPIRLWTDLFAKCTLTQGGDTVLDTVYKHGLIKTALVMNSQKLVDKADLISASDNDGSNLLHLSVMAESKSLILHLTKILTTSIVQLLNGRNNANQTPVEMAQATGVSKDVQTALETASLYLGAQHSTVSQKINWGGNVPKLPEGGVQQQPSFSPQQQQPIAQSQPIAHSQPPQPIAHSQQPQPTAHSQQPQPSFHQQLKHQSQVASVHPQQHMAFGGSVHPQRHMAFGGSVQPQQHMAFGGSVQPQQHMAFGGSVQPQQNMAFGGSVQPQQHMAMVPTQHGGRPTAFRGSIIYQHVP